MVWGILYKKIGVMSIILILLLSITMITCSEKNGIIIRVPAIEDSKGDVFDILVQSNSNNTVIINGPSKVDNDTIASIWSSLLIANILSSSNYWKNGFTIVFPNDVKNIGGPSASLALTLAFLKLLNNDKTNTLTNYSITGAINLNGLTVAVGGITLKYKATIDEGLNGILIPIGNVDDIPSEIDKIIPIKSIQDLYLLSQGFSHSLSYHKYPSPDYPEPLRSYLETVYIYFKNNTKDENEDIKRYLALANEAYSLGKMYAASSLAFTAYTKYNQELYSRMSQSELKSKYESLLNKVSILTDQIEEIEKQRIKGDIASLFDIELLSLAEARLWMCASLLENFKISNFTDKNVLAQAETRCITSELWIKSLDLKIENYPVINISKLNNDLELYMMYLEKLIWYIESLIIKMNATEELTDYLSSLKELYNNINSNIELWNIPLKYGLTVELAQNIVNFLDVFNLDSVDIIEKLLIEEYSIWNQLYNRVVFYRLDSLISNIYLEYSLFMKDKDPSLAYQLGSQAIVTLYPLIIYTKVCETSLPSETIIMKRLLTTENLIYIGIFVVLLVLIVIMSLRTLQESKHISGKRLQVEYRIEHN